MTSITVARMAPMTSRLAEVRGEMVDPQLRRLLRRGGGGLWRPAVSVVSPTVQPNEILHGTLQMAHGWAQANANLLTHADRFDPVSGFPLMKSVEVTVEPLGSRFCAGRQG